MMINSFKITQISTIVFLILKVKSLSNCINIFKSCIALNLGIAEDLPNYLNTYGEKQTQKILDKAVAEFLDMPEQENLIPIGDYLLNQPRVNAFLTNINTLDDLAKSLDKYLQAFPKKLKKLVEYYEPQLLNTPLAELPLQEAESFIDRFLEILDQPNDLPYIVTPFNLNGKLQIQFAQLEDAEEYARKLFPSDIRFRPKDGSESYIVGSY